MRGGVVSFGQGLVFALGGYAAALAVNRLGVTDALGLLLAGGVRRGRPRRRRSRRCLPATAASSSRC